MTIIDQWPSQSGGLLTAQKTSLCTEFEVFNVLKTVLIDNLNFQANNCI